jgi:hypothetical protein
MTYASLLPLGPARSLTNRRQIRGFCALDAPPRDCPIEAGTSPSTEACGAWVSILLVGGSRIRGNQARGFVRPLSEKSFCPVALLVPALVLVLVVLLVSVSVRVQAPGRE